MMSRPDWKSKNYEGIDEVSRFSIFLADQERATQDEGCWAKAKRHLRQYWYLYLPGSLLGLLVFLLILYVYSHSNIP